MIKLTILDGHAVNPGDLSWDSFKEFAEVTVYERTSPDLVAKRIGNSDAIFLNKITITKDILEKCPNLKYIGVLATGYNVVDLKAACEKGIVVTNIPAYSTDAVAQHVFAFILHFTNLVSLHEKSVKQGDWITSPDFCYWNAPLTELSGKTLGIFGYGNIGKKVSLIAKAFGMNVICTTRTIRENMPKCVSLKELFSESDFISLHAPLTEETKNLVNEKTISFIKPSAYLINTARGGFVDEEALAKALNQERIAGYAADVVNEEPMNKENPLRNAKNCVITPHIAWAPKETRQRLQKIALENFKSWINKNVQNQVN